MYKLVKTIAIVGAIALATACGEPPVEPTSDAPLFAKGGAGRPVVTVNPKAKGNGAPSTIQGGIDLVAPGGRVQVLPGTYVERLVIDKGLTIHTIGNGPVVLAPEPDPKAGAAIYVTATDPVVIRGLTIDCACPSEPGSGWGGVFGWGQVDLTIEEVTVLQAGVGVVILNYPASSGGRARLVVRDSYFDGGSPPTMAASVFAVTDVDALIEGIIVRRTTISCIQPQGRANVDVIGNDVDECGPFGAIRAPMSPGTVVNIVGNTVRNSGASGSRYGIHFRLLGTPGLPLARACIENNTIIDYVQESAPGDASAINIRGDVIAAARFNDISGNALAGLIASTTETETVDATNNWWGSADGPSGDGDAVFGNAEFIPFATAPIANTSATSCSGGF